MFARLDGIYTNEKDGVVFTDRAERCHAEMTVKPTITRFSGVLVHFTTCGSGRQRKERKKKEFEMFLSSFIFILCVKI